MNQNNPNLLFYSKKCKTCELFINTCHNNNVLRFLKLICVDENIDVYQKDYQLARAIDLIRGIGLYNSIIKK